MNKVNGLYKVGVIGGMGPASTVFFMDKVVQHTEASKDQDHIDMVVLNHVSLPDRTEILASGDHQPFVEAIIKDVQILQSLGVSCIAIPCNTAHYFYGEIQKSVEIPVINMVEESVLHVSKMQSVKTVGILATNGSLRTKLYENACAKVGLKAIAPSEGSQKVLTDIIYKGVKGGNDSDLAEFLTLVEELRGAGADVVLLACTELSYFKSNTLPLYCVDAMDVLVQKVIELSGKKWK
jgi:aspartate racemase